MGNRVTAVRFMSEACTMRPDTLPHAKKAINRKASMSELCWRSLLARMPPSCQ